MVGPAVSSPAGQGGRGAGLAGAGGLVCAATGQGGAGGVGGPRGGCGAMGCGGSWRLSAPRCPCRHAHPAASGWGHLPVCCPGHPPGHPAPACPGALHGVGRSHAAVGGGGSATGTYSSNECPFGWRGSHAHTATSFRGSRECRWGWPSPAQCACRAAEWRQGAKCWTWPPPTVSQCGLSSEMYTPLYLHTTHVPHGQTVLCAVACKRAKPCWRGRGLGSITALHHDHPCCHPRDGLQATKPGMLRHGPAKDLHLLC